MIYDVAEILKECIESESLPYVETLAGLVQTETRDKLDKKGEGIITRSYPIYCPEKADCEPNQIEPLVPDRKRTSLFYFENNADTLILGRTRGYVEFQANLRLVGWLNPKKLGVEDCSITAPIVAQLLVVLDKKIFNDPARFMTRIQIMPTKVLTKNDIVFKKYKYNRKFYSLLEFPYDYFGIDISVKFAVPENCITNFVPGAPTVC